MDNVSGLLGVKVEQYRESGQTRYQPSRVTSSQKSTKSGTSKKKLNYNFKELSKQITRAKTSSAARPVVTKIRKKIAELKRKLGNDEYDEEEVRSAIEHAEAMMRIAQKRVKNLKQEELAARGVKAPEEQNEDDFKKRDLEDSLEELENPEQAAGFDPFTEQELDPEQLAERFSEEMDGLSELTADLNQGLSDLMDQMSELEAELMREFEDELDALLETPDVDMSPDDLEDLKRKHRNDEQKRMTHADMKYLKALFDKYQNDKANGVGGFSVGSGVSLSLGGNDIAVAAPAVVADTGGAVDISA